MKTEKELIDAAFEKLKNNFLTPYESPCPPIIEELGGKVHCRTQVEIAGNIADGLMFFNSYTSRIIGLEAKTDKDNYSRLYSQINGYLAICDEVYLVVENKKILPSLPFFVGVIRVNGDTTIEKYPMSLKHSINANEYWSTLLKAFNVHCGVRKDESALSFFDAVETIKRKLIWNQFVIGFHQTYVKEYIPLADEEKRIVRAFFGKDYQMQLEEGVTR